LFREKHMSLKLVFTATKWLVCSNHPIDKRLFKVWASDEKWLYSSLRISFTFHCKFFFNFSFKMMFVHIFMSLHVVNVHTCAVFFWVVNILHASISEFKLFLLLHLLKMTPYPRCFNINFVVWLSLLGWGFFRICLFIIIMIVITANTGGYCNRSNTCNHITWITFCWKYKRQTEKVGLESAGYGLSWSILASRSHHRTMSK